MSSPIRDGGRAFPVTTDTYSNCKGMNLRDWFAGMPLEESISGDPECDCDAFTHAKYAYELADQMNLVRDQPVKGGRP